MSQSFSGGYRYNRSSRPSFPRRQAGPKRSYINPSRYTNTAKDAVEEKVYEIQHTFEDFGLTPQLLENVLKHGYTTPTPIQDQAIPALMSGRDVVGIANTGTGKTAAFLLPLIHKIAADPDQGALIIAPTRELALQIHEEFQAFAYRVPVSVCLCIGGASLDQQLRTLYKSPHFIIGTPGRIIDVMKRGAFDPSLFTNIVLDEVDRMLDIGFRRDIQLLISKLAPVRHAAFFSATMNADTEGIMKTLLTDPVRISVKTRETSDHIHQEVIAIKPGENKIDVLHQLLQQREFEKVIVFGRTKHGIDKLENTLRVRGMRVASVHGNKTQGARQRSLQDFKRGMVQALLATDIAARGIDVEGVTHVINYDEPASYEDYVHRIGRTGRAGSFGKALTFIG